MSLHGPLWPNQRGAASRVTRARLSEKEQSFHLSVVALAYLFFCIGSRCHVELVQQSAEGWRDEGTIFFLRLPSSNSCQRARRSCHLTLCFPMHDLFPFVPIK